MDEKDGYLSIEAGGNYYQIYYRRFGGSHPNQPPLLVLHGGPGAPHNYLENLRELATTEREVIFYDQLGSGLSDKPDEVSLWRAERFVAELGQVIKKLGLAKVDLLGQSWGGMLALDYALTQPGTISRLILADTTASMPQWASEAARLRRALPEEIQLILDKHEQAGTLDNPEYQDATLFFYERHVCRIPWPPFVAHAFEQINQKVYNTMWGATEFSISGNLKDWERRERLAEIDLPTLIISGEYDESTPAMNQTLHNGIRGAEWVLLKDCSHLCHVEAADQYFASLTKFLNKTGTQ